MTKVLYGSYGDGLAFMITESGSADFDRVQGWRAAEAGADLEELARAELRPWFPDRVVTLVLQEVTVPKRAPARADLDGTHGEIRDDGVDMSFGGACPVQGDGTVDGLGAYYRARGAGWTLSITLSATEEWSYTETPYAWPDAGWLAARESEANIRTAVAAFRRRWANATAAPDAPGGEG